MFCGGRIYFMNMNTRIVEIIIGAVIIILAGIVIYVTMHNRAASQRQGTEQLTAEQVVGLEVQADAQNNQ